MVMPCSRSASSPSVRSDRSMSSCPRLLDARATAASWSCKIARVSCSSRPISVLLPSSTLPAVIKRSTPRSPTAGALRSISPSKLMSEVPFLLAPLHGRFGSLVVHTRRAAFGDGGQHSLGDDLGGSRRDGFDRAGAADVPHGAEADRQLFDRLAGTRRRDLRHWNEQAVAAHYRPAVRVVGGRDFQPPACEGLPDVG